ncbi:glycosyltransferase family 2 protein [Thermosediminibacter oceani]|uniref:Glucosyl-3-phosphoglycerate synthase n=1 Tax=Thermosediminibacter oceani (strain ATCC BAA-1034 / DSM 16646 / JW/IW-1228P) TaxID=555079 RepID=D9RYH3_THEOJ|nr:glycosyltransferase family 2 protein [Thermosediminibacter oceani]ADL08397.1 glycosyl transferase family 2 [Thermosediminibacter oceani DSM 16646]
MEVSVVIPAFNEEDNIASVVKKAMELHNLREVIVVDDGSSDRTARTAASAGAIVIKHNANLGKGKALMTGFEATKGEIVVFLDADLRFDTGDLEKLIEAVVRGDADMTIARFPRPLKKGGFGFVKALAGWGVYLLTGHRISAPLSGQRAIKREVLESVKEIPGGFGAEVGFLIDALRKGFRVVEVDVNMRHRETGRSLRDFAHRGRQFVDILVTLLRKVYAV